MSCAQRNHLIPLYDRSLTHLGVQLVPVLKLGISLLMLSHHPLMPTFIRRIAVVGTYHCSQFC